MQAADTATIRFDPNGQPQALQRAVADFEAEPLMAVLPGVALDEVEPRSPVSVEHDQFGVEDRGRRVHAVGQLGELGIGRRDVVQPRRLEPHPAALDERERPVAVPLDLEQSAGLVERLLDLC